jgi:tetratricopeptide (TPR) repeat protein
LKDQGRSTEAKAAWVHALELSADRLADRSDLSANHQQWCDCANDLAWFLVTTPDVAVQDSAQALSLATKAAQSYPECGTYWNTLGVVRYRVGDFRAAVVALDRATALGQGGTAFDHYFLAMAHVRLGNQEQARRSFAQATLWMEQHHPGHVELLRLRDEARATLFAVSETSGTAY